MSFSPLSSVIGYQDCLRMQLAKGCPLRTNREVKSLNPRALSGGGSTIRSGTRVLFPDPSQRIYGILSFAMWFLWHSRAKNIFVQ
jgi:hypothetical protein